MNSREYIVIGEILMRTGSERIVQERLPVKGKEKESGKIIWITIPSSIAAACGIKKGTIMRWEVSTRDSLVLTKTKEK